MDNKRERFINACSVLTQDILSALIVSPEKIASNAQEIQLRVNRPVCVQCKNERYFYTKNGCITNSILDQQMVVASKRNLFDIFQNICNYSVYSRQYEINNGFITLKGGHRAGICGTAVITDGKISNVKDISSINIRIARQIKDCAKDLYENIDPLKGVLICGAPCSGKTTILRDLARLLSYKYKISIIDERNEISSTVNGVFQNDIGLCDIFDNYPKSDGISQAVRSMSPDIIVCDEVGTQKDVDAIISATNSGVSFISTIHSDSTENLISRKFAKKLLKNYAFSQIVFLDSRENVGRVKSIQGLEDLLYD